MPWEAIDNALGTILYGDDSFEADWDVYLQWAADAMDEDPAAQLIALPSAISFPERFPHLAPLREQELDLRRGQANDVLATIRQIVGQLSFQWKKGVRLAPDKARATRARKSIEKVHRQLALKAKLYERIRIAMEKLGMPPLELASDYRPLLPGDLAVSKAVKAPNARGESQAQLSWIWTSVPGLTQDDNHLLECKVAILCVIILTYPPQVYRVNWLRARAKQRRWSEELILTQNEMEWTTRFFYFKSRQWRRWGAALTRPSAGQVAYVEKQMAMWENMGAEAYREFLHVRPNWDMSLDNIRRDYLH